MLNIEIREQVHKLIDAANQNQLDAVLELLQPSNTRYTQEELNSFYKRVDSLEANNNRTFSIDAAHDMIRNKFQQNGV